jgi:hypothetical protein
MPLQPGRPAEEHEQEAGRERIQRPCVPGLDAALRRTRSTAPWR